MSINQVQQLQLKHSYYPHVGICYFNMLYQHSHIWQDHKLKSLLFLLSYINQLIPQLTMLETIDDVFYITFIIHVCNGLPIYPTQSNKEKI